MRFSATCQLCGWRDDQEGSARMAGRLVLARASDHWRNAHTRNEKPRPTKFTEAPNLDSQLDGRAMTLPDLATLRRLHEAATVGPWTAELDPATINEWHVCAGEGEASVFDGATVVVFVRTSDPKEDCGEIEIGPLGCQWNAELIAASRNALPALLHSADQWAQVQGMRDELERLTNTLTQLSRMNVIEKATRAFLVRLLALIDAPPNE